MTEKEYNERFEIIKEFAKKEIHTWEEYYLVILAWSREEFEEEWEDWGVDIEETQRWVLDRTIEDEFKNDFSTDQKELLQELEFYEERLKQLRNGEL